MSARLHRARAAQPQQALIDRIDELHGLLRAERRARLEAERNATRFHALMLAARIQSLPDAETTAAPERLPYTRPVSRRPADPRNQTGAGRTSPEGMRAADARQERL